MGGKKRKHSEAEVAAPVKKDEGPPERPKRTLLGWKDKVEKEKETDSKPGFRNKEKVLVTCSRRISYRYRHLMMNMVSLLPHCKKDNKVESKESKGATLNELVELKSCSSCLFFECRKQKDLYLWMAKCPSGPSVKFLVNAVHTMEELKLTGNHLKGSRPILTFSNNFDKPHWKLLKEIIMQEFTPDDGRYDVIWVQWCIGHLTDDDFVSFFKRAKGGLKPGGIFVLKENIARTGFILDKEDRSITRSDLYFKELFDRCGLHIYKSKDQKGFPEELFQVKIYALTPDLPKRVNRTRPKGKTNRPGIIK